MPDFDLTQIIIGFLSTGLLVGLMVAGVLSLAFRPELIHAYTRPRAIAAWSATAGVSFLAIALLLADALSSGERWHAFTGLSAGIVITFVVALCCWGLAMQRNARLHRPWGPSESRGVTLFSIGAIAWSIGSMVVLAQLVPLEIPENSFLQDVTPENPLFFAGVFAFAMVAAVLEEIIYRGALVGLLEKTPLGDGGAILVAAFLFALAHGGYTTSFGPKEVQIVGLGVIRGYARLRYGLSAAVIVHLANNFFAMTLTLFQLEIPGVQ